MINELLEVQDYLNGKNLEGGCTFRMCTLLAKYFYAQNLSPLEIRQNIFNWANANGLYIEHNVNDIIRLVIQENVPLFQNDIYLSEQDIEEIRKRFDSKNARLCALGLLLYVKAHANEDGKVTFNQADFAKWTGITRTHLNRYFDELETFDYAERAKPDTNATFYWNGRIIGKQIEYRVKVPYENVSGMIITDNNLRKLYNEIFS